MRGTDGVSNGRQGTGMAMKMFDEANGRDPASNIVSMSFAALPSVDPLPAMQSPARSARSSLPSIGCFSHLVEYGDDRLRSTKLWTACRLQV